MFAAKIFTHPEVAARLRIIRDYMTKRKSVLLFTNTRSVSEVLASRFKVWDIDFPISIHHGSLGETIPHSSRNRAQTWRTQRANCYQQPRTRYRCRPYRLCYPVHESTAGFSAYPAGRQGRSHLWSRV
jgi:hypothetical protein